MLMLFAVLTLWSCKPKTSAVDLDRLETALAKAQYIADSLRVAAVPLASGVKHIVFLELKPEITDTEKATFLKITKSLKDIPEVKAMSVAERTDTGDKRALDYDVVLYMTFATKEDLAAYDQNEFHQQVRQQLGEYLASPPATFDYVF